MRERDERRERPRRHHAEPRQHAEIDEQHARRVGADAEIERMTERDLSAIAAQDVPALRQGRVEQRQDQDVLQVDVADRGRAARRGRRRRSPRRRAGGGAWPRSAGRRASQARRRCRSGDQRRDGHVRAARTGRAGRSTDHEKVEGVDADRLHRGRQDERRSAASTSPTIRPAASAPKTLPKPPSATVTIGDQREGRADAGVDVVEDRSARRPRARRSAAPSPQPSAKTRCRSMPTSATAPWSSRVASRARPKSVRVIRRTGRRRPSSDDGAAEDLRQGR